ncbi:MAG: hypothetical protein RLY74_880 [Actinomycetota bacterium]
MKYPQSPNRVRSKRERARRRQQQGLQKLLQEFQLRAFRKALRRFHTGQQFPLQELHPSNQNL